MANPWDFDRVADAIKKPIEALGIKIFLSQCWPGCSAGYEQPNYEVGVIAGYRPNEAAIYSVIFRLHPYEDPAGDHLFQFHIASQHRSYHQLYGLFHEPLLPPRIMGGQDFNRGIRSNQLPTFGYRATGPDTHTLGQFLTDARNPLADKAAYGADLFGMFLQRCKNTLADRFTHGDDPYVVPDHSTAYEEIRKVIDAGHLRLDVRRYFWAITLAELHADVFRDPGFPCKTRSVGLYYDF